MEEKKLTWAEIKKLYYQQWVELVDYDWPDGEPYPLSGVLRSHGAERKAFYQQCKREPVPSDSAIVFVGPPPIPKGVVLSPSLIRIEPCEKSS